MNNLILDLGNTFIKAAVFKGEILIFNESFIYTYQNKLSSIISKYSINNSIISAVTDIPAFIINVLKSRIANNLVFNQELKLPIKNHYKTPETLGNDRIALATGAYFKFPNKNTLIIDAGTCITYDFINSKGKYYGGSISPGIEMRYKALNSFTSKLPFLNKNNTEKLIGTSTNESIISGVQKGIIFEIISFLNSYKKKYPNLKVILTGGDSIYLSGKIKSRIFVDSNFLLYSLNRILLYNVSKTFI